MIIPMLRDGLGNQMFIYAAARSIQEKTSEKICIDTSYYSESETRQVELNQFILNKNVKFMTRTSMKLLNFYIKCNKRISHNNGFKNLGIYTLDNGYKYSTLLSEKKNKILCGFFQNPLYFKDIKKILQNEFVPVIKLPDDVEYIREEILHTESVCVHIRRGDYITDKKWSDILCVCDYNYYNKAINYISEKRTAPVFYIFSNNHEDIEWIKANYNFGNINIKYIDMNNISVNELTLMSSCRDFIISNSTFGWWAQYLSVSENKIVCAPSVWHKSNPDSKCMYGKGWIIL